MQNYKVTYSTGKNEHVMEVEAEDKEHAYKKAQQTLGRSVDVKSVIHLPEQYGLELF